MSSILKALKKLENEQSPQPEDPSLSQKINTKRAINQRAKGIWIVKRLFIISMVMVAILIFGLFYLNFKDDLLGIFFKDSGFSAPVHDRRDVVTLAIQKKPTGGKTSAALPEGTSKGTSTPPEKKSPPRVRPGERMVSRTDAQRPGSPVKGTEDRVALKPDSSPTRQKEPVTDQNPSGKKSFDESKFRVEAIIWSSNPKNSFAVVNGKIVRSGEEIDGLSVTHIGRDYVAVKSSEGEGKLKFTLD